MNLRSPWSLAWRPIVLLPFTLMGATIVIGVVGEQFLSQTVSRPGSLLGSLAAGIVMFALTALRSCNKRASPPRRWTRRWSRRIILDMDKQTRKTGPSSFIHVDNVHKSFLMGKEAVQALRGVSLDVARGEMICLMGPSGSGKTTLLNIIGGLEEPSRGHVSVDGENIVALSEDALSEMRLYKMGFVFQSYNLLANFTAQENIEVPMALSGVNGRQRRQRARQLLESVGLADRASHYPSELSGGQQQRVAVARALANDPPVLIGDEITGDLDSVTGFEVMEIVGQLNRERGTTVLYVTHDPRMARFANRVIQLRDGRIAGENAVLSDTDGSETA